MSEYPMVEEVNRLIGNRLAAGGELFLPGVGSLHTERRGARRITKRTIEPPFRMVVFSSQPRGEALPALIARAASCGEAAAQEIYARYLEQTFIDGILTVGGVGVLKLKHFRMDEAFDRRLNPQGRTPVRIRSLHRFDWALWCGVAAIVFAALFGGYQFLMLFPDQPTGQTVVAAGPDSAKAAVPADTLAPAVADSLTAGPGASASAEGAELSASGSGQAEKSASGAAASADDRTGISAHAQNTTAPSAQQAENAEQRNTSQQVAGQPTEMLGGQSPTPARQTETARQTDTAASDRPASLVSGRKYVVLGVFSTPENAARAVRTAASATPALPCRVYRFGEKFMVSPFESDDAAACARFIGERKKHYRDLWTYTAR